MLTPKNFAFGELVHEMILEPSSPSGDKFDPSWPRILLNKRLIWAHGKNEPVHCSSRPKAFAWGCV